MTEEEIIRKHQSQNGKKGGNATKERHGSEHYKKISKLALEKRWGKKELQTPPTQ